MIAVIGSLNMDLISRVPHIPLAGETMTSTSFTTGCGGKGANQAVACSRLSRAKGNYERSNLEKKDISPIEVRMVGAVGDDSFGEDLKSSLRRNGVDVGHIQTVEGTNTGIANILVDETTGENRIILSPGANHRFSLNVREVLRYLKPNLIVLQHEIPIDLVERVIRNADEMGIPTLLNPAPAESRLGASILSPLAHLILNETETAVIARHSQQTPMNQDELALAAHELCERGIDNVVITMGAKGSIYRTKGGESGHVSAQKVTAMDTTAAGDTFVGSYALSSVQAQGDASEPFNIKSAVGRATKAAAITVQRHGAQDAIPWMNEV